MRLIDADRLLRHMDGAIACATDKAVRLRAIGLERVANDIGRELYVLMVDRDLIAAWPTAEEPQNDEPSRIITAYDEDGNEEEYLFVDSFEHRGKTYAVLAIPLECDESEYDMPGEVELDEFIYRLGLDENGDEVFVLPDDGERAAAEAEWARICEEDDELGKVMLGKDEEGLV